MKVMTAVTAPKVHKDWLDSPLVRKARRNATGSDALDVLSALSDLLNELEERCPGVPFTQILAAPKGGASARTHDAISACLASNGFSAEETQAMIGTVEAVDRQDERSEMYHRLRARRADGLTLQQIADEFGISKPTVCRWLNDGPPTHERGTREMEIGEYCHHNGWRETADHYGVSKSHALNCQNKFRTRKGLIK